MLDTGKMRQADMRKMRAFNVRPKESCLIELPDFKKVKKIVTYKMTKYVIYECRVFECDGKILPEWKHHLQIPRLTCWNQLYSFLEGNKLLEKKNLVLKMVKKSHYHYDWNLVTTQSENHSITSSYNYGTKTDTTRDVHKFNDDDEEIL